jgi:predicted aspartyl protease
MRWAATEQLPLTESVNVVLSMSGNRKVAATNGRRIVGVFAGCILALAATPLLPQQPPAPSPPQQPGASEKVHTGVTSGLDTDARLQNLLADHQFLRIESQLDQLPPDQLSPEMAQFYRGILANRNNDLKTSIQLLEPLVDQVAASGNVPQEKVLRKTLAEDYLRSGDLAKAAKAYQTLETRLHGHLSSDELDEMELPLKLLPLAAANPPMTVESYDPFRLQVARNPLGLTDLPVYVDARPHSFMLDPTAPFNLIARSLAKEAGLNVSAESATIHTLTGRPMQVHVTVIPRFTIGGRITFRNMTAFVFEDADYFFAKSHFQVEGVLGYPALSALGSLTITADDTIEVRPFKMNDKREKDDQPLPGARFFLDGDQMIVALGKVGEDRMYVVDASSQQTYLTSRYYEEHAADFAGQKMQLFALPGHESSPPQPAFVAETIPLEVGPTAVSVHYIQVLTQPLGSAALDDVYGVLGLDVLDQLRAYTFDYRAMRFSVKAE